ncbi:thiopeptide-type bacteriocin biosynthesis protein [Mucilaginibacter sp. SJ]|uniref:thiopeptide-type bacteriocin biosynthesis protein n=1 Tax=Mucilaginibacter sp. SJ TaxID=3029053 RepID=UPI0023A9421B|nr:thiopeptide-type bacteriocin biosynthesis protein [Mucilaginibacter sp. SJ]WEA00726.1 thiopeptide-type bacteriocin biosynthesis protein [Mucilaginibacter sp. SJ]
MIDNENFEFYDQVVLRTPYYSFKRYALSRLPEILVDQAFLDALWLASPSFYRILENKAFRFKNLTEKEIFSLYKYYNRMSFRPTPFGAFASFSLVKWDNAGEIRLDPNNHAIVHLLPSRRWQADYDKIMLALTPDFRLIANRTIYQVGNVFRYIKTSREEGSKLRFDVNELDAEELNREIITFANTIQKRSFIVSYIQNLSGCDRNEAEEYANFLLEEQVLISEMEGSLYALPNDTVTGNNLKNFASVSSFWERVKLGKYPPPSPLPSIFSELNSISEPGGLKVSDDHFYSALARPQFTGGVSPEIQNELRQAINLVRRLVIPYSTPFLKEFKEAFKKRFDNERVPLLKAIDPDTGVGYGGLHQGVKSALLADIAFSSPAGRPRQLDWTPVHKSLMKCWISNQHRNESDPVEIKPEDYQSLELPSEKHQIPQTIAVLFSQSKGMIVLDNVGGASATSLIGRFSPFDHQIELFCKEIAAFEGRQNPDIIFAELHQLSDEHTDNINRRRPVYDSVITINTFPDDTGQQHINLSDLVVWMNGDQLILESKTLGKRVIPRLPTAYNFQHNDLAVFQMLCDLQFEGLQANLTFDPERVFPDLRFYPRFYSGKVILSMAKWKLDEEEVNSLITQPRSIGKLHLFRQKRGIPRMVTLGLSDRQLVFDLADDKEALFFLDCLKETKPAIIREYLVPDNSVRLGKDPLAGQFLAVLKRKGEIYTKSPETAGAMVHPAIQRLFIPGRKWLYLKIYCTEFVSDQVLSEVIRPLISSHRENIQSWFFIRYSDPDPHLRVRVKVGSSQALHLIADQLSESLTNAQEMGMVSTAISDAYQREVERYSPELIESVEEYFQAGSEWVINNLDILQKDPLSAFGVIYKLTEIFLETGLLRFFEWRAASFVKEFGGKKELKLGFDRRYRQYQKQLGQAVASCDCSTNELFNNLINQIAHLSSSSSSWSSERRHILLADLLHMQVNRMFNMAQRHHEGLIFYCLFKYEVGRINRAENISTPAAPFAG